MTHPFERFNLADYLIEAISDIGFKDPTEIQKKVIPEINKGRDIIGQSQTGSGKTHAFLLPLFNNIDSEIQDINYQYYITEANKIKNVIEDMQLNLF